MRWMSFQNNGAAAFGYVDGDNVVDVSGVDPQIATLKDAIVADALPRLGAADGTRVALSTVRFDPVITMPDKIFCVGLNYKAHQEETGRGGEGEPTIFTRFAASQMGHGEPLWRPAESQALDFEGEIAMIIGRGGRRISQADAMSHVVGFAPYNDGSVRDWQRHTSQFTPGKNFAHTGGFGPWMMTPGEIGDLDKMEITTRLNGEVMQNAAASLLVFGFEKLIEYCSAFIELAPGDVIVTGTPGGVGAARKPPLWMKPGDTVDIEVSPIGTLSNPVTEG